MFNSDLIDDLAREKVVLFLGAGVSASATTASGSKIRGWDAFLRKTAEVFEPLAREQIEALLKEKDYLLACEIMQMALGEDWQKCIVDEFGQKAIPSTLHKSIIRLKQRIILTTNFDKLLESAWEANDVNATHYPRLLGDVNDDVFKALKDHSRNYIIKIHGNVDNPKSMVFSRSEYIRSAFGNVHYGAFLESLLLNYTFLFVGFSMNDPAITSLMEMYALRYPIARPHYIFTPSPIAQNISEINKRLRKLVHIMYDPKDGHAELPVMIDALGKDAQRRKKELFASSQK